MDVPAVTENSSEQEMASGERTEDYAVEVSKCILGLREQRERLRFEIIKLNNDRQKNIEDIRILVDRLAKITNDQTQKSQYLVQLDKTIEETETAYAKLVESSKGLFKAVNDTEKSIQSGPEGPSRTEVKTFGPAQTRSPAAASEARDEFASTPTSAVNTEPSSPREVQK